MTDMRFVGGEISLTEWEYAWNFNSPDLQGTFVELMLAPIEETIRNVFKDDPPWLTLGNDDADPLMLDLFLALGADMDRGPQYQISLRELIASELDFKRDASGAIAEVGEAHAIAAALRQLADKIDQDLAGTDRDFYRTNP